MVAATATDTGTTIVSPPLVSRMAPEYMPYGVSAGTLSVASNEPVADECRLPEIIELSTFRHIAR